MTEEEKDLIADLLVRWEDVFDEEGKDIPVEELCADCPHLATEVQEKIEGLKATAWMKDFGRPLTDERDVKAKDISGKVLSERYRLDQLLGSGGYGQVYKAFDLKLQRPVAVKIGHYRTSCDLMLDEARRVARLKHHSIITVHDCGEYKERVFLVFELVEGKSLADLARKKKLSVREAVELVACVAETLHYAHEKGCFHRDIKPENILIDSDGNPLIADFGVACTLNELEKGRIVSSGTLAYMSPEQISNEVQLLDGRCDIHALAIVLFELLTGQSPFPAKDRNELREQILFRQPKRLREIDSSIPETIDDICWRAMSKHPGDRLNAEEFSNELRGWLEKSKKRRRGLFWGILIVVVLLVTGGFFIFPHQNNGLIQDGVLHFNGKTRIVTDVKRTLPVTLEAWIKPDPYRSGNSQFIIGSDIPGKYGIGLSICGSLLSAEYIGGMINSNTAIPPNKWSHVAGVFTETETRLFLNGKLVAAGPGATNDNVTKFVIGNAGENNLIDFYRGDIRSVRISEGERYSDRFIAKELVADANTLLMLDGTVAVRDGVVRDREGGVLGQVEHF